MRYPDIKIPSKNREDLHLNENEIAKYDFNSNNIYLTLDYDNPECKSKEIIIHETMHWVLGKMEGERVSRMYDNLDSEIRNEIEEVNPEPKHLNR